MTAYYRNIGARFTSDSGERVGTGHVFVPTPRDLKMRSYKLVPVALHEAEIEGARTRPARRSKRGTQGSENDEARDDAPTEDD